MGGSAGYIAGRIFLMSSGPIPSCNVCGQLYWSMDEATRCGGICSACQALDLPETERSPAVESLASRVERLRCMSLSQLPPEKRPLPRREQGLTVPRRPGEVCVPEAAVVERSGQPLQTTAAPLAPVPAHVPLVSFKQLGFNCPSCYTVLVIKDPENYDGRAAPCPYCSVTILPPRVMPPTPFTLLGRPSEVSAALKPRRWNTSPQHQLEDPASLRGLA